VSQGPGNNGSTFAFPTPWCPEYRRSGVWLVDPLTDGTSIADTFPQTPAALAKGEMSVVGMWASNVATSSEFVRTELLGHGVVLGTGCAACTLQARSATPRVVWWRGADHQFVRRYHKAAFAARSCPGSYSIPYGYLASSALANECSTRRRILAMTRICHLARLPSFYTVQ
jgi:hypothetical protein